MKKITIASASPAIDVGNIEINAENIEKTIREAHLNGAEVVVFPELSLTGCSCRDIFGYKYFADKALRFLDKIIYGTKELNIYSVIGLPVWFKDKVYSGAAVIFKGEFKGIVLGVGEKKKGVTFEFADSSFIGREEQIENGFFKELDFFIGNTAFKVVLGDGINLVSERGIVILNPNTDIENYRSREIRMLKAKKHSFQNTILSAYPSHWESTSEYVYPAHHVLSSKGEIIKEEGPFYSGIMYADIPAFDNGSNKSEDFKNTVEDTHSVEKSIYEKYRYSKLPFVSGNPEEYEKVLDIQSIGLMKRMRHINSKKILLGISGGLDSTLAAIVAHRTVKKMGMSTQDVIAVSMPSFGSSERTKNNAEKISKLLGFDYREIDITESVKKHFTDIGHSGAVFDAAFENAQARERTQILMDMANMNSGIHLGTGDLSESALGFTTYNGDHMSMYNVNATVPKTLVREVVLYAAGSFKGEIGETLKDICETPISPELSPLIENEQHQKTEEIVGPYELHDFFIYHIFVLKQSPAEVFADAIKVFKDTYNEKQISNCMREFYRRFFGSQFKRSCMPEGPMVTEVSFSPRTGFVIPSDFSPELFLKEPDIPKTTT
ncbi:MAG: NAD(+) synthase [Ruminococcaceae bacterium]|nr:NAD(+) synthase [Oscillospiraceae bacterium]